MGTKQNPDAFQAPIFRSPKDIFDGELFNIMTLPLLAKHYKRDALLELQKQHTWLDIFESSKQEPDLDGPGGPREKFFIQGSDCINILDRFGQLKRIAVANDFLTASIDNYIWFVYELYKSMKMNTDLKESPEVSDSPEESERIENRFISKSLDLEEPFFLDEAKRAVRRNKESWMAKNNPFRLTFLADKRFPLFPGKTPHSPSDTPSRERRFLEDMRDLKENFERSVEHSRLWHVYKTNLQAFTLHVGCLRVHDEPADNIAELRLFNATRMPFFQQLRDELRAEIIRNNKQQEIITALVFRHLIENLPAPYTEEGKEKNEKRPKNATDRWQFFWDNAIKKENQDKNKKTHPHPLTSFHNHISGEKRAVDPNGNITAASIKCATDVYISGKQLYSMLSTNIHKSKFGNDSSKTAYTVRDDQWGETYRGLLRALPPKEENIKDGEVDWEAERKKYLE